jgi:hypothetical protein
MKNLLLLLFFLPFYSQAQVIITVAGGGSVSHSGDGGPATNARLDNPHGIILDNDGNLLIATNNTVRKVSPPYNGIITTIAGVGINGFSGDGGLATNAQLSGAYDVAVDKAGNMYISEAVNNRIRKVTTDGIIRTIAGTGTAGYNGDGIPATAAQLNAPYSVTVDDTGNVYIGDAYNFRIRKIDTLGIIHTLIGTGTSGFSPDGSSADTSFINAPTYIRYHKDLCLYFTDNNRIRKLAPSGIINTVAGNGGGGYDGDGGLATMAQLCAAPNGIAFDTAGCMYITATDKGRVRKVNLEGAISTIAGTGISGPYGDGGDPLLAYLAQPTGITVAPNNDIFVSDRPAQRVRMISSHIVGIPEVINKSNDLIISPNPAKEQCTIQVNSTTAQQVTVVITDVAGREVHHCTGTTRQPITIATCWPPGMYTVTASTTATEQHTTTIVVQ